MTDKMADTGPASEQKIATVEGQSCACSGPLKIEMKVCCPSKQQAKERPPYVTGTAQSCIGEVRRVSAVLTPSDKWGMVKCRISAYRDDYKVEPGLYAVGGPGRDSEIFVSANYKYSFDVLRRELEGIDAWLLVLDTKGINVWCAAGKGTFGTGELINRISSSRLGEVAGHRRIIVPQLGAVGVNAHEVRRATGFKVHYGPVRAADIGEYLKAGLKAGREMRTVRFNFADRLVLTPMEVLPMMKKYPVYALAVLALFGLEPSGIIFRDALWGGLPFLLPGLAAVLSGAFLTPVLLPYVPFRSFAVKGWITGAAALYLCMRFVPWLSPARSSFHLAAACWVFFPMASSYIALQFTGSTTFTGMTGVKKELRTAIPVYLASAVIAVFFLLLYKFGQWGIIR